MGLVRIHRWLGGEMIKSGEITLCDFFSPLNPNGIGEGGLSSSLVSLGSLLQQTGFPKWEKMVRCTEGGKDGALNKWGERQQKDKEEGSR